MKFLRLYYSNTYRFAVVAATAALIFASIVVRTPVTAYAYPSNGSTPMVASEQKIDDVSSGACVSLSRCFLVGNDFKGGALMLVSTNEGANWQDVTLPNSPNPTASGFVKIICQSSDNCVALGWSLVPVSPSEEIAEQFILATTDGGTTWSKSSLPSSYTESGSMNDVSCISSSDCMVVAESDTTTGSFPIIVTTDAGLTWHYSGLPGPSNAYPQTSLGCELNSELCVTAGFIAGIKPSVDGLSPTTNYGTSWNKAADVTAGLNVTSIGCFTSGECLVTGYTNTDNGVIITSSDKGSSWHISDVVAPANSNIILRGLACLDSRNCVTVGYMFNSSGAATVIARSTDSGQSWQRATLPSSQKDFTLTGVTKVPSSSEYMAYATQRMAPLQNNQGTLWSSNKGSTWTYRPITY
ncbi:MAG TPA: sialidase family protein [Candidatus Saccharimonadales bacterium]|nr:sialidase family protein [Candidatus Saccharimonadales bacterium]